MRDEETSHFIYIILLSEVAFPFFCCSFGQLRGYAMNLYAGWHQIEAKFGGLSLGNEIFCSENLT